MHLTGLENKHADIYKGEMKGTANRIHKMVQDRVRFDLPHDKYDMALILFGAVSESEDLLAAVETGQPKDVNGVPVESTIVREELEVLAEDLRHLSTLARNHLTDEPAFWNEDIIVDKTIPISISLSTCLERLDVLANQMDGARLRY